MFSRKGDGKRGKKKGGKERPRRRKTREVDLSHINDYEVLVAKFYRFVEDTLVQLASDKKNSEIKKSEAAVAMYMIDTLGLIGEKMRDQHNMQIHERFKEAITFIEEEFFGEEKSLTQKTNVFEMKIKPLLKSCSTACALNFPELGEELPMARLKFEDRLIERRGYELPEEQARRIVLTSEQVGQQAEQKLHFRTVGERAEEIDRAYREWENYALDVASNGTKIQVAVVRVGKLASDLIKRALGKNAAKAATKLFLDTVRNAAYRSEKAIKEGFIDPVRVPGTATEGVLVVMGEDLGNYRFIFYENLERARKDGLMELGQLSNYDVQLSGTTVTLADYSVCGLLEESAVLMSFFAKLSDPLALTEATKPGFMKRLAIDADLAGRMTIGEGGVVNSIELSRLIVGMRESLGITRGNTDSEIEFLDSIPSLEREERFTGRAVQFDFSSTAEGPDFFVLAEELLRIEREGLYELRRNKMRYRALRYLGRDVTDTLMNDTERALKEASEKKWIAIVRIGDFRYVVNGMSSGQLEELREDLESRLSERGIKLKPNIVHVDVEDATRKDIDAAFTSRVLNVDLSTDSLLLADRFVAGVRLFTPGTMEKILLETKDMLDLLAAIKANETIRSARDFFAHAGEHEDGEKLERMFIEFIRRKEVKRRLRILEELVLAKHEGNVFLI